MTAAPSHSTRVDRVLLVGGYGVVGTLTARMLRKHHPQLKLIVAGRTKLSAEKLASELGNSESAVIDTSALDPLNSQNNITAVVGLVHDPDDHLLRASLKRVIPYLDITRGVEAQTRAYVAAALEEIKSPALFASNWMAGVPAILAAAEAKHFEDVDTVDFAILFDQNDKTGPDSAGAGEGITHPMTVRTGGKWASVGPVSAPSRMTFPSGRTRTVFRMNIADALTLAQATGAKEVFVRIGLASELSAKAMRFLINARLWNFFQSFGGNSPAHNANAKGAAHEIIITITGKANGRSATKRITLLDPQGQAHMTAIGVVANLERLIGLRGAPLRPGIAIPETAPDVTRLLELLEAEGVAVALTPSGN